MLLLPIALKVLCAIFAGNFAGIILAPAISHIVHLLEAHSVGGPNKRMSIAHTPHHLLPPASATVPLEESPATHPGLGKMTCISHSRLGSYRSASCGKRFSATSISSGTTLSSPNVSLGLAFIVVTTLAILTFVRKWSPLRSRTLDPVANHVAKPYQPALQFVTENASSHKPCIAGLINDSNNARFNFGTIGISPASLRRFGPHTSPTNIPQAPIKTVNHSTSETSGVLPPYSHGLNETDGFPRVLDINPSFCGETRDYPIRWLQESFGPQQATFNRVSSRGQAEHDATCRPSNKHILPQFPARFEQCVPRAPRSQEDSNTRKVLRWLRANST